MWNRVERHASPLRAVPGFGAGAPAAASAEMVRTVPIWSKPGALGFADGESVVDIADQKLGMRRSPRRHALDGLDAR